MAEPALCVPNNDKMRGKIPSEKKEMYGSQEGYILTKFNQWRHNNIKMPILVLVVFCKQLHLMQKQSLQNQQPQQQFLLSMANSYQSFYGLESQKTMKKNSWVVERFMLYL